MVRREFEIWGGKGGSRARGEYGEEREAVGRGEYGEEGEA